MLETMVAETQVPDVVVIKSEYERDQWEELLVDVIQNRAFGTLLRSLPSMLLAWLGLLRWSWVPSRKGAKATGRCWVRIFVVIPQSWLEQRLGFDPGDEECPAR